jgi:hypothetical protein
MSEFSSESNPFDDGHIPEQPDDVAPVYEGSDPMVPPDFYPVQEDELVELGYAPEVDTAAFMAQFQPADHLEVRFEDMQPASREAKQALADIISARASEGVCLSEARIEEGVLWPEAAVQCLLSTDEAEQMLTTFFPTGMPMRNGDSLIGSVVVSPNNNDVWAAYTQTTYKLSLSAGRLLHIEKHVSLEAAIEPRPTTGIDDMVDRRSAIIDRLRQMPDRWDPLRVAEQQDRELGLSFVSEFEAQTLVRKMSDAVPFENY